MTNHRVYLLMFATVPSILQFACGGSASETGQGGDGAADSVANLGGSLLNDGSGEERTLASEDSGSAGLGPSEGGGSSPDATGYADATGSADATGDDSSPASAGFGGAATGADASSGTGGLDGGGAAYGSGGASAHGSGGASAHGSGGAPAHGSGGASAHGSGGASAHGSGGASGAGGSVGAVGGAGGSAGSATGGAGGSSGSVAPDGGTVGGAAGIEFGDSGVGGTTDASSRGDGGVAVGSGIIGLDARHGAAINAGLFTFWQSPFDDFRSALTNAGYQLVPLANFRSSDFSGLAAIILAMPYAPGVEYSASEIADIASFVASGGGAMIQADAGSSGLLTNINLLAATWGVTYSSAEEGGSGVVVSGFVTHPVTQGVDSLGVDYYRQITFPTRAVRLTTGTPSVLGAMEGTSGAGNLVFIGDESLWTDDGAGSDYDINSFSNHRLLLNIARYIAGAPR